MSRNVIVILICHSHKSIDLTMEMLCRHPSGLTDENHGNLS
jgi:hypothetical protein